MKTVFGLQDEMKPSISRGGQAEPQWQPWGEFFLISSHHHEHGSRTDLPHSPRNNTHSAPSTYSRIKHAPSPIHHLRLAPTKAYRRRRSQPTAYAQGLERWCMCQADAM
ncbi:uncharacterized protein YALI1_D07496g [Yarrowia lipolytica]|uniref:Uncharacterized protein n=1 Tax=Yarrowia lipolytica TaxID=4952 RepID=A0A1D8NDC4_YARLL|nr:hypothetical protein YALI1_D07496g [Yarrowia lipolytica]